MSQFRQTSFLELPHSISKLGFATSQSMTGTSTCKDCEEHIGDGRRERGVREGVLTPYTVWVAELVAVRQAVAIRVHLAEFLCPPLSGREKVLTKYISPRSPAWILVSDAGPKIAGAIADRVRIRNTFSELRVRLNADTSARR